MFDCALILIKIYKGRTSAWVTLKKGGCFSKDAFQASASGV